MGRGERAAAAAMHCVGAPFRLGGCDPATGMDCVGVAAVAVAAAGHQVAVPRGYRLRGGDPAAVAAVLEGLARGRGDEVGGVLLLRAGPAQLHLAVRVPGGVVHADAGLRRVVMRPGQLAWPLVAAWRMEG
jgi:hypothetical protein